METVAIPLTKLRALVEQAEALDSALGVIAQRQVPAVAAQFAGLRLHLRDVGALYHEAVDHEEAGDESRLLGPSRPGRQSARARG